MTQVMSPAEIRAAKAAGKGSGLTNLVKRLVVSGDMYLDLFTVAPEITESKAATSDGTYDEAKLVRNVENTIKRLSDAAIVEAATAGTTSNFPSLSVGVHNGSVLVINDDKLAEAEAEEAAKAAESNGAE
jgi:hypothetical protein